MATVEDSEQEFFFGKQIHFLLLKFTVDLDWAEAPRDGVCDGHKTDPVLILDGF